MATYNAILDPTITTVLAGPTPRTFSIHKSLLLEHSDYFRRAYYSNSEEARNDLFTFADINASTFRAFVVWLYHGKVCVDEDAAKPEPTYEHFASAQDESEHGDDVEGDSDYEIDYDTDEEEGAYDDLLAFDEMSDYDSEESEAENSLDVHYEAYHLRCYGMLAINASQLSTEQLKFVLESVDSEDDSCTRDGSAEAEARYVPKWRELL